MGVTSAALQASFDEIEAQTPAWSLEMAPHAFNPSYLEELAAEEGSKQAARVSDFLATAARPLRECQVCQRRCRSAAATSSSSDAAAAGDVLAFVATPKLDFAARTVRTERGAFACGRCRAVRSTPRMLQLLSPGGRGGDGGGGGGDDRAGALAQDLLLHLAAVNGAPQAATANAEALALWGQELLSRAYALRVAAGGVRGWRLEGPGGRAVERGAPGAALQLAKRLLAAAGEVAPAPAAQTPVPASAKKTKKGSKSPRRDTAAEAGEQAVAARTPVAASKALKRRSAAAAACAFLTPQPAAAAGKSGKRAGGGVAPVAAAAAATALLATAQKKKRRKSM